MQRAYVLANQERNTNLLTIFSLWDGFDVSHARFARRHLKNNLERTIIVWEQDGMFSLYINKDQAEKVAEEIVDQLRRGRRLDVSCMRLHLAAYRRAEDLYRQVMRLDPLKKSSRSLSRLLRELYFLNVQNTYDGSLAVMVDIYGHLSTASAEILRRRAGDAHLSSILTLLQTPRVLTPSQVLKKKLFRLHGRDLEKYIALLCERHPWIEYNYQGPEHTAQDYRTIARRGEGLDVSVVRRRVAHLFRQHQFSARERQVLEANANFAYQKLLRVDTRSMACFAMMNILREFARRTGWELRDLLYCTLEELRGLERGLPDVSVVKIRRRRERCATMVVRGKASFFYGSSVDLLLRRYLAAPKKAQAWKDVPGQIAFVGKVRGTVKVVYGAGHIQKVKQGDILMAYNTTPEVLPAMRLAAGFISEMGGITCHAAIVAREMRKPCLVGVRDITQLLHDGDQVELDAVKGFVRKI